MAAKRHRAYKPKYTLGTVHFERREKIIPCQDQFTERELRLAASQSMSDIDRFLGVPPPGFSALDQRKPK